VLDIGGGTGRNTLALARRGHPVDVVEMTPKFADIIRAEAERVAVALSGRADRTSERDAAAVPDPATATDTDAKAVGSRARIRP